MKKLTLFVSILFISICLIGSEAVAATEEQLKVECMKKVQLNMAQFHHEVMEDVFTSFNIPFGMKHRLYHITFHDLAKFRFLHPEQEKDIESLTPFLTGTSIGEKRVYFLEDNLTKGSVLFKDLEGNNHMITVKRTEDGWVEESKTISKGSKMHYMKLKCEEEYHIQQFFNDLFQGKN
jgi:hypothetical protein